MKTLLITSIYSDLYGTEFGGRSSRDFHYRASLLSILKLVPTKVICFTSKRELRSLEKFFYEKNKVNPNLLEFRTFELNDSKYFDLIYSKKDLDKMKSIDRCFEIQYNKFFWFDIIDNTNQYDRVYWIDAGLSHSGLFPKEHRDLTKGYQEQYYEVDLFKPSFLDNINSLTNKTVLLIAKNNKGGLYWSQGLPSDYFDSYDLSKHIIGGMFGGTPDNYKNFRNKFEALLLDLLNKENSLFMEEQIMTCLYRNFEKEFTLLEFDDWMAREDSWYKAKKVNKEKCKIFYEMFL